MAETGDSATAEIARRISASPKYRPLLSRSVMRVVLDCTAKYGRKQAEKSARNILHQAWGAYYPYRPKFEKQLETLKAGLSEGRNSRDCLLPLMDAHSSTAERAPSISAFYERIFAVTGIPSTILDLACGLNTLTLPWMDLPEKTRYEGRDIDEEQNSFLNSALALCGFPPERALVRGGDILCDEPENAEMVFMLKLLPLLEHQKKGSALELLRRQPARHIVTSYPSGSLSGGKRKMGEFHAENFLKMVGQERWTISALTFDREVVFIVGK